MVGFINLTQFVHGSTNTGPAWTSKFTPLTSPPEIERVAYDVTVSNVHIGDYAWVNLSTTVEDGTQKFYDGTISVTRTRVWYYNNGYPPYGSHVK